MARTESVKKQEEVEMSLIEQIKALDEKRNALVDTAKGEALKRAEDAVAELVALGFAFRLVEGGDAGRQSGEKRAPVDKPCEICGFKTIPLHDRRAHRAQEPKRAFTADELDAKGIKRI